MHTNRFTYSAAGDLLTLTDPKNQTTQWQYDHFGRVTNKLDQAWAQILRYMYDAEGQLTNRWSVAKGTTGYLYDAAARTFTYDAENQLTSVGWGGGNYRTDFVYDGRGRMRRRIDHFYSGGSWNAYDQSDYVYDGMRLIQERTSANTPTVAYTWGQDLSGIRTSSKWWYGSWVITCRPCDRTACAGRRSGISTASA